MIDCERQLLAFRDPSGEMLTIYVEGTRSGSAFCYASMARQRLKEGCVGFMDYVVDTRVVKKGSIFISDVPVVCDFSDVFPKELPGVPPERKVVFRIHLIPGPTPISKASYCLELPEMKELSS